MKQENKKPAKWLERILITGILASLTYMIGGLVPKINELSIYNPLRNVVKQQFLLDHKPETRFVMEKHEYQDREIFAVNRGIINGQPYIEYEKPEKITVQIIRHPLLDGLTDQEFYEIVNNYKGSPDYAKLTKYVKERKK